MACMGGCSCSARRTALALLCALALSQALDAAVAASAARGQRQEAAHGSAHTALPTPGGTPAPPALNASATVTVDLAHRQPTSPLLYGIFFEEASTSIGHAGDGGLYAELVQDRSFDALAAATGFAAGAGPAFARAGPTRLSVSLDNLAAQQAQQAQQGGCMQGQSSPAGSTCGCAWKALKQRGAAACGSAGNDIIIAWSPLPGTATTLTREQPLNPRNLVAMELSSTGGGSPAGIVNSGYWGVPVEAGVRYTLSLYLRVPQGSATTDATVALLAADSPTVAHNGSSTGGGSGVDAPLAAARFSGLSAEWQRFTAELVSPSTDLQARLAVLFDNPGCLVVDSVSLFPSANTARGRAEGLVNPWPFRRDLLDALRALRPRFLRFPGGCYVEGDWLRGAFRWKTTLGGDEERPGHHNSMWGYWSTDGLGVFEYLLLAEELGAEPIWVVNNGIAHNDQVPTSDIWPWEALDGIEFITGPPNSTWGAVRAAMGRPEPWALNYVAIGNEGCGLPWDRPDINYKPHFAANYLAFYGALKAAHPHLRLIANCAELREVGPTEVWEYHVYTNPQDMFARRHAFDGLDPAASGQVFASEYAVTDGGGQGNVLGAVAEAGFMLGLERNSRAVLAGAYAPLFVNANARPWPTNMIVFDNSRFYGIPSYHVQQLLSAHLGSAYLDTQVEGPATADTLAAAASCLSDPCSEVAVKLVNFSPLPQRVSLRFQGLARGALGESADLLVLGSSQPLDENSFEAPAKVSPRTNTISGVAERFELELEPWSLTVLRLRILPPSA
ncbi:hypothetical protein ABPG75_012911 [Micractinium tetrahymenae]